MVPYLLNPTTYGYETCTIEYKVYNSMWEYCDNPMFCWVSVKPGLWTGLDSGLDWTMDWTGLD